MKKEPPQKNERALCFNVKNKKNRYKNSGGNLRSGGGRGIRTPARFNPPVGFQDRSLQPDLGIPPYNV